jgi:hypothetical protein
MRLGVPHWDNRERFSLVNWLLRDFFVGEVDGPAFGVWVF